MAERHLQQDRLGSIHNFYCMTTTTTTRAILAILFSALFSSNLNAQTKFHVAARSNTFNRDLIQFDLRYFFHSKYDIFRNISKNQYFNKKIRIGSYIFSKTYICSYNSSDFERYEHKECFFFWNHEKNNLFHEVMHIF